MSSDYKLTAVKDRVPILIDELSSRLARVRTPGRFTLVFSYFSTSSSAY